jgi:YggT family protein
MRGNYLGDTLAFLVETLVGLYMFAVLLRFLLQWVRADFYNPISQFLVRLTNPPLKWLRRFVPGLWGMDLSSLVLLFTLALVKVHLVLALRGRWPSFGGALVLSAGDILQLLFYVLFGALILRVIASWIAPQSYHPGLRLADSLTEPLLAPARRLLPAMGGLDLSPILVFIALEIFRRLVVQPVLDLGIALSLP